MNLKTITDPHIPYSHKRLLKDTGRLCDEYSDIVRVGDVSFSEEGREIPVLTLGKGEKKFLFAGGIHGREYVSVGFLMRCVEEYAQAYTSDVCFLGTNIRKLLCKYSFHIVPVCNPDSVEITLGKALPRAKVLPLCADTYKNNTDNVNLNANFPYLWDRVPTSRQPGSSAACAKETRFLMSLCEKHRYEKLLSFHCRGNCLYWRDEGNGRVKDDEYTAKLLCSVCSFSLCPATRFARDYVGGFENWFRHRFSRCAICVELVADEQVSYRDMCTRFEHYTNWERTKYSLLVATGEIKHKSLLT